MSFFALNISPFGRLYTRHYAQLFCHDAFSVGFAYFAKITEQKKTETNKKRNRKTTWLFICGFSLYPPHWFSWHYLIWLFLLWIWLSAVPIQAGSSYVFLIIWCHTLTHMMLMATRDCFCLFRQFSAQKSTEISVEKWFFSSPFLCTVNRWFEAFFFFPFFFEVQFRSLFFEQHWKCLAIFDLTMSPKKCKCVFFCAQQKKNWRKKNATTDTRIEKGRIIKLVGQFDACFFGVNKKKETHEQSLARPWLLLTYAFVIWHGIIVDGCQITLISGINRNKTLFKTLN